MQADYNKRNKMVRQLGSLICSKMDVASMTLLDASESLAHNMLTSMSLDDVIVGNIEHDGWQRNSLL